MVQIHKPIPNKYDTCEFGSITWLAVCYVTKTGTYAPSHYLCRIVTEKPHHTSTARKQKFSSTDGVQPSIDTGVFSVYCFIVLTVNFRMVFANIIFYFYQVFCACKNHE